MSVFLGHILRFCVVMLLSAFGTNMAFAVPTSASNITYFQPETTHFAQGANVSFASRAPPIAVANIEITGGVTVMRGGVYALHWQETVAALFGFDADHIAPNTGAVPDNWTRLNPAGAQINAPRGYTTYRTPDGDMVHVSPSGLQYGADPKFGNRVDHVLDHTAPNPNKPVHSVFNAQGDDALNLVDEAWLNRSGAGTLQANGNRTWTVDLGRPVGTNGQTSVQIVVRDGTSELITAFPQ